LMRRDRVTRQGTVGKTRRQQSRQRSATSARLS
jgi:hypothetical protein